MVDEPVLHRLVVVAETNRTVGVPNKKAVSSVPESGTAATRSGSLLQPIAFVSARVSARKALSGVRETYAIGIGCFRVALPDGSVVTTVSTRLGRDAPRNGVLAVGQLLLRGTERSNIAREAT